MSKIYIGITGLARSGKNLFADIASKLLREKFKLSVKPYALAYYLKQDCEEFISNKLNLSVWSEVTEDKEVFRPFLVWYGGVKRKQTNGKYWTDLLKKDLDKDTNDVNLITDIRYGIYNEDESFWIKNTLGGKLVHVSKYEINSNQEKVYIEPPNEHEKLNDPIMKAHSDFQIEWEHVGSENYSLLLNNEYLISKVEECLSLILNESKQ